MLGLFKASALWQAEVEEMRGKTRTSTLYLVAGLLLPVWDRLPDDHVQVWRLNTDDGQSFLGRIVPAPLVSKLADAFGINAAITVSGDDTAKHVMTSGEISSVGAYRLKRSLVAGQQRLELLGVGGRRRFRSIFTVSVPGHHHGGSQRGRPKGGRARPLGEV